MARKTEIKPAKSAQNMSFPHTNYKSEQIYTVTYNYIFHENVSNVNPFSVGSHFNLTRLVWVKANKFISFRFCDCYVAAGAGVGFQKIGDNFIPFLKSVLPRPNNAKCRVYIFKHIKPRKLAYYKSR